MFEIQISYFTILVHNKYLEDEKKNHQTTNLILKINGC